MFDMKVATVGFLKGNIIRWQEETDKQKFWHRSVVHFESPLDLDQAYIAYII